MKNTENVNPVFNLITKPLVLTGGFTLKNLIMEVIGKIKSIGEIEIGTSKAGKDWKKCEFVLTTNEQYPKDIAFTLFNDRVQIAQELDQAMINQLDVEVHFNLESREYNGRYFHNVNAWRCKILQEDITEQMHQPESETEEQKSISEEQKGDFPF